MYLGEPLFREGALSPFLAHRQQSLREVVEPYMASHPAATDDEIVSYISDKMSVRPLDIDFENYAKDVQERKIRVRDFGRNIEIDGVLASRSYPFTGDAVLFKLTPSTWTTVLPYGRVTHSTVIVGIEGRKDLDALKRELHSLEKMLRDYTGWQKPEIEQFNAGLPGLVQQLVANRRKHQDDIANLRDQL
ncbi:hypothetical protein [Pseudorhodoplanes sp.]|uniref:hypothetical protein n=1 Tax=Pseudorhodoplanes sp. TaxID=1934341 RepID=UPI003D10A03A